MGMKATGACWEQLVHTERAGVGVCGDSYGAAERRSHSVPCLTLMRMRQQVDQRRVSIMLKEPRY